MSEREPGTEPPPPRTPMATWKRALPWLVGIAIVIIIVTRVPLTAFRDAVGRGPHLELATVDFVATLLVLCTDSAATWIGLAAMRLKRPLLDVTIVRGATYALFVLNYALGQGAFGFYLHRSGVSPLRATGATLFLIGTNLIGLLVLTTIAWATSDDTAIRSGAMWWLLVGGCAGLVAYLVVIGAAPAVLTGRQLFMPLFAAGLRGHAIAVLGRVPHVVLIVLVQWVAIRTWGVPVPFAMCVTAMPIVVIASVLPISPAGLGTAQAAFVYFFATLAPGATADERTATVLAFGIVHFVYSVAASLLVGLACLPFARRGGLFDRVQAR